MDKVALLRVALILFIIGDLGMLLVWFVALFLGIGIPAYATIIWLLVLHIMSFRSLSARGFISKKLLIQQIIAGIIIIGMNSLAIYTLWSFSDSTANGYYTSAIMPTAVFSTVCIAILFVFSYLSFKLLKKSYVPAVSEISPIVTSDSSSINPNAPVPTSTQTPVVPNTETTQAKPEDAREG